MDNATSNDTLVDAMEAELGEQNWSAEQHRMRCFGHIVNLAAVAFIYGDIDTHREMPGEDAADEWRRFGCLGRLHNIIVFIQRSPQRRERFRELCDSLNLHRDNKTRWNSWYTTIERARQPAVKAAITAFTDDEEKVRAERLSFEDWGMLKEIQIFLKPFYDTRKATEGMFHSVDRVLPGMEYLLRHTEAARTDYADHDFIRSRVDASWAKLDEYYSKTDATIAYIAATVMNPVHKWQWFTYHWTATVLKRAIGDAKRKLRELWRFHYQTNKVMKCRLHQRRPTRRAHRTRFTTGCKQI